MGNFESVIAREDIDWGSSVPIYSQISSLLKQRINRGVLKVGDMLPSEMYLCDELHISRSTIRKTFAQLEADGLIVRKRGKGTFVAEPKLKRNLNNLYNFSTEMRMLGFKPLSRLIAFDLIKPSAKVANQLGVLESELVYKIVRLRLADGNPMLLETAYIPQKFCPDLSEEELTDSLYALISDFTGALPMEAVETYDAVLLTEKQAKLLDCMTGAPAFKIQRVSKNTAGEIFETSTIIAPGDKNRYQIALRRDNISYSRKV